MGLISRVSSRTYRPLKCSNKPQNYQKQKKMSKNYHTSSEIKIYMTTITSTIQIEKKQQALFDFLDARKIQHERIDMCANLQARPKMLSLIPTTPESGRILPPQVFNGDDYCGDYDAFVDAKEMDL